MLIVYWFDPETDLVAVTTIQEGRTSSAATGAE
jgi:hypothetical protein